MGLVEAVMSQPFISIERELGDSRSVWWGNAIAADIMVCEYDGTESLLELGMVDVVADDEQDGRSLIAEF